VRIHKVKRGSTELMVVSYPLRRPRAFASLSSSELDVVEGVMSGLSQSAVAERQGTAPRTVANQLASAYAKLGVRSLTELSVSCSEWQNVRRGRGGG